MSENQPTPFCSLKPPRPARTGRGHHEVEEEEEEEEDEVEKGCRGKGRERGRAVREMGGANVNQL